MSEIMRMAKWLVLWHVGICIDLCYFFLSNAEHHLVGSLARIVNRALQPPYDNIAS